MKTWSIALVLSVIAACSPAPRTTGAPLSAPYSDDDGVPDDWEDNGVSVELSPGKTRRLDLKGIGGSSRHKDIYVWLSWMKGDKTHVQGHEPPATAFARIVSAFANAPGYVNADGTKGIFLHIIKAPAGIEHNEFLGTTTAGKPPPYDWSKFEAIKKAEFPDQLRGAFHFALIAHRMGGLTTATGNSRGIPASDFIITLGDNGNIDELDGTFMHELGHNLGLHHGGTDPLERKPNYLSVMNYSFQFDGLWIDGDGANFDYSRFKLPRLDETRLDRAIALTPDAGLKRYGTQIYCSCNDKSTFVESIGSPIDWDCSQRPAAAKPTIVNRDVDRSCQTNTADGAEDWSRLQFTVPAVTSMTSALRELTQEIAREILIPPVRRVRAGLENRAVRLDWQPISLNLVMSYKIDRTEDGRDGVFTTYSERPPFVDREVVEGRTYSYAVSAILANRGGPAPLDLGPQDMNSFLTRIAPSRMQASIASDPAQRPALPDTLYQTTPSTPARVSVVFR